MASITVPASEGDFNMHRGKGFYITVLIREESHPVTALQPVLVSIHTPKQVRPNPQTQRSSAQPGFSKGVQSTKRNQQKTDKAKELRSESDFVANVQGKSAFCAKKASFSGQNLELFFFLMNDDLE